MKTFSRAVNLIRIVLFPYFRQHKIKVLLSIFGVALGVAVFIAIRSASVSAKHAMKNLVTSFSSEIDLQVTYGRDGFYETVYPKIALLPGVKKAIPVIYAKTSLKQGDKEYPIQVYGVDITQGGDAGADAGTGGDLGRFLSLPNELLVSESFLEAHGLNKESPISLVTGRGRVRFHVAGVMKAGSMAYSKNKNMVIMDLFAAQYHFEKKGKLDRVDIDVADGYDPEKVKASIIAATGGILRVRTPDERVSQAGSIFQSFELNLTVVSMISLLVGMYLIYNTINTSILHQRREIGILRALGATQADIMMLFSLEGALIGIVGSALGLALGWLLASVSVEAFTHNLSRHYLLPDVTAIHFSGEYLVLGFAVGMGMTLLSSVIPSMATVKISPIETIRSVSFENIKRFRVNKVSIAGLGILVLAYFSSQGDPVNGIPVFGFTSNLLIIVGLSFLSPLVIQLVIKMIRPVVLRLFRVELTLAGQNLLRAIGRNSITISTLMISIALIISIFTLIASYHFSINKWFDHVNNAEFSILSGTGFSVSDFIPMREDRVDSIRHLEAIKDIDRYRFYTTSYKKSMLDIHSFDLNVARKYTRYTFIDGDEDSAFDQMDKQDGVFISAKVASKYSLRAGDHIRLTTKNGERDFKIAAVVVNYLSQHGVVSMPRRVFKAHWEDDLVDVFKFYLKKGMEAGFEQRVYESIHQPENLIFSTLKDFKDEVFAAIDETFTMFHALELITVLIAILGVVNALLASILERKREIGILRSIGATRKQIATIILSEAGYIGVISSIIGIIAGILLSFVTVFVINKQTVGVVLEYYLPLELLAILSASVIFLTILAGYYPSRKALSINIREALEYE